MCEITLFRRSPTPLNIYPRIFTKLTEHYKRGVTSHSTSWGKRSSYEDETTEDQKDEVDDYKDDDDNEEYDVAKRSSTTGLRRKLFALASSPWNVLKVGYKRGGVKVKVRKRIKY